MAGAFGLQGSSVHVFLNTRIFNNSASLAVPEMYFQQFGLPATTLSATLYAGAESDVPIDAYRLGDFTQPMAIDVTVSGYYVSKP